MNSLLDTTYSDDECWSESSLSSTYISESDTDNSSQSAQSTSSQTPSSRYLESNKNEHSTSNVHSFAKSTSFTQNTNNSREPGFDVTESCDNSKSLNCEDLNKTKGQNLIDKPSNITKATPKLPPLSTNLRTSPQSKISQERNFWNDVDASQKTRDLSQRHESNCTNNVIQACHMKINSTLSSTKFLNDGRVHNLPEPSISTPTLAQLAELSRLNNYPSDYSVDTKESLAYSIGTSISKVSASDSTNYERSQSHQIDILLKTMSTLVNENKIEDLDLLDVDDDKNDNEDSIFLPRQGLWSADEDIDEPRTNLALTSDSFADIIQDVTLLQPGHNMENNLNEPYNKLKSTANLKIKNNDVNHQLQKSDVGHKNSLSKERNGIEPQQQNDQNSSLPVYSPNRAETINESLSNENKKSFANTTKGKKKVSFFENIEYDTPHKLLHWDQIYHHHAARTIQKCYKKWRAHHSMTKLQLKVPTLSQKNAIIAIQALVRGRSCRHAILCRVSKTGNIFVIV